MECHGECREALKMSRFRTLRWVYFSRKIDFEHVLNRNFIVFDKFFHAESESGNGFWLSRPDFAGLPDSKVVYGPDLATLEIRY